MSNDERIEAALRRQPADERDYSEPLTAPTKDESVQRRPVARTNGHRSNYVDLTSISADEL